MAEFALDTGFLGYATLPLDAINKLNLEYVTFQPASMADGTEAMFDVYSFMIECHGKARAVDVPELPGIPLIGMSLLEGCELRIQIMEEGLVTITPLLDFN